MQRTNQPTCAGPTAPAKSSTRGSAVHAKTSASTARQPPQLPVKMARSAAAPVKSILVGSATRRALQTLDSNRFIQALDPAAGVVKEKPVAKAPLQYVSRFYRPPSSSTTQSSTAPISTAVTGLKRKHSNVVSHTQPSPGHAEETEEEVQRRENIAWLDMLVALLERKYKNHQHPVCIDDLVDARMLAVYTKLPIDDSESKSETPGNTDKRNRLSLEPESASVPMDQDKDERRMQALKRHAQQIHDTSVSSTTCCGCKTGCLKMYCACFTTRGYCHDGCNCDNCKNTRVNGEQRLEAITTYLLNDPRAFSFASAPQDTGAGFFQLLPEKSSTVVLRGCRCKKSKCLKKYCECFQNGLGCSPHCRCVDCANDASVSATEQREKNRLDRATSGHAFHAIQVSVTKKPRRNFVQKSVRLRL